MIAIQKKTEPLKLYQFRQKPEIRKLSSNDAYKKMKGKLKKEVLANLVEEQGDLCAYCMCRIPCKDVEAEISPITIEHFIPRNPVDGREVGQGLDYNNMLAVCHGNKASKGKRNFIDLTCDAHRENTEFRKVNPCRPETLTSIFYTTDGKIDAKDSDVRFNLVDTLNLNCPSSPLVEERKATLDSLIDELDHVSEMEFLDYCKLLLKEFQEETGKKTPYVGILIWYLKTTIEALESV